MPTEILDSRDGQDRHLSGESGASSSVSSLVGVFTPSSMDCASFRNHLELLQNQCDFDEVDEVCMAPIFTESVRKHVRSVAEDRKQISEAFNTGGLPCEAAFLSSQNCAKVRLTRDKRIYACLPNVRVEELRINESDLNTKRMLDLMAVSSIHGGGMPLYLHVVTRILRDLRIQQQHFGTNFNYSAFKQALEAENLSEGQRAPLQQRLETLESFMVKKQADPHGSAKPGKAAGQKKNKTTQFANPVVEKGNDWTPTCSSEEGRL
ncbi:hypothetical protein G7Z17_g3336 [Cylindrodendrum hubeiense]|uniref:Uncharacterized protein n=1 Tax=Cylindrodendrum hubeiense TaxID=595255 RepID=A0A9P5HCN8_9HYPO|nr:hypothetical protein G7Z17_g3336 [Cylindrodendrum hubeiense]